MQKTTRIWSFQINASQSSVYYTRTDGREFISNITSKTKYERHNECLLFCAILTHKIFFGT
ncbi:MAG: hypothetical protein EAY75_02860 [Bacteroidetes bacterium]|nr:MAG: hypothetical protein EAY75_02860 [Bacteroidota bacterium]